MRYDYSREDDTDDTYDEWLQDLEERTKKYISSGTVKYINTFPSELVVITPWGYLFRDGKLIDENSVFRWAAHPGPILKELERD